MDTIEKCLDYILQCLIDADGAIFHFIEKKENDEYLNLFQPLHLNVLEFTQLLGILKKEEYIIYENVGDVSLDYLKEEFYQKYNATPYWIFITIRGRFFHQRGGYVEQANRENREKNRLREHDRQIRLLTYVMAFGAAIAALYYVFEFVVWCRHH